MPQIAKRGRLTEQDTSATPDPAAGDRDTLAAATATAAARLAAAQRVAVLTGSGISAESGVPTFRDAQTGLWARYEPTELATPEAFARDPELVWTWYQWRRELIAEAPPNAGHAALAAMADRVADFTLITQNVDGLHARAGSRDVLELHGNITRNKRVGDGVVVAAGRERPGMPPTCPETGDRLRPDVVWFGEQLPLAALAAAEAAARRAEVFLSVGTSSLVYPAAALPQVAKQAGAFLIEINPDATPLSPLADVALRGPAGEVLPQLAAAAWPDA